MNPLEKMPHLFCNGKFRVKHPDWGGTFELGLHSEFVTECMANLDAKLEHCQLIARPIEDITDKELLKLAGFYDESVEELKDFIIQKTKNGWIPTFITLKLLSIGVYPFDQKAFQDGTVLDSTEPGRN